MAEDKKVDTAILCDIKKHIDQEDWPEIAKMIYLNLRAPIKINRYGIGLFWACKKGKKDVAEWMISKGAKNWNLALFEACQSNQIEMAELMIAKGATDLFSAMAFSTSKEMKDMIRLKISLEDKKLSE